MDTVEREGEEGKDTDMWKGLETNRGEGRERDTVTKVVKKREKDGEK